MGVTVSLPSQAYKAMRAQLSVGVAFDEANGCILDYVTEDRHYRVILNVWMPVKEGRVRLSSSIDYRVDGDACILPKDSEDGLLHAMGLSGRSPLRDALWTFGTGTIPLGGSAAVVDVRCLFSVRSTAVEVYRSIEIDPAVLRSAGGRVAAARIIQERSRVEVRSMLRDNFGPLVGAYLIENYDALVPRMILPEGTHFRDAAAAAYVRRIEEQDVSPLTLTIDQLSAAPKRRRMIYLGD